MRKISLKTGIIFALGLAMLTGVTVGRFVYWAPPDGDHASESVDPLSRIQAMDRQGKLISIWNNHDAPVIIHFWATWCAPCVDELPEILRFAQKWTAEKIVFHVISLDVSWRQADRILPKELPGHVNVWLDPAMKSAELIGSFQFPETYLLDRKRRIVMKWVGPQEWNHPSFGKLIERLLQKLRKPE